MSKQQSRTSPPDPFSLALCRERTRAGFSFLELQVAFVIFGIALAGLYPLVVMQSRHLKKLDARLSPQTPYYLIPSTDEWARKLGAAASVKTQDPGPPPPPPVLMVDNGDPGYSEAGTGWQTDAQAPQPSGEACRWHAAGMGTDTASWLFTQLPPGWYDVRATWLPSGNRATNAPYTVYDGPKNRGTFPVDQTIPPLGDVYQGSLWQSLSLVSVTGNTVQVNLSDQANGCVIADGVRLVPVRNQVQLLSLQRSMTGEEVTAHVFVNVQVPQ